MTTRVRHCEICRQPIDAERAEALPETRLCTEHGRAIQAFGGEFVLSSRQERTSKAGSLKVNYGGVSVQQRRNKEAIERLKDAYELADG